MEYDPRDHGADCANCVLREERWGAPVPSEWPTNPIALLVGEAPGEEETEKGAPFVGAAGQELSRSLAAIGIKRSQVALSNALLCRPPDNNLDRVLHRLRKENKKRALRGEDPIPTPMACCSQRLREEVAALPKVVALGKIALQALTGRVQSITEARGGPIELSVSPEWAGTEAPFTIKILPAFHPAHVMRFKRWRGPLRADLGRAFRWFGPGLNWREPVMKFAPRPAELRLFLDSIRGRCSVLDVETFPAFPVAEHYDANLDPLQCLGIGTADGHAIVVPFRSVETGAGWGTWYHDHEFHEIITLLKTYLSSPEWPKGGWNSRVYDASVIKHHFGIFPSPNLDGIALHRVAEPEMKHGLGIAGGIYTDVDKWKKGHKEQTVASDQEQAKYNATDTVVTAMTIQALAPIVRERKQTEQSRTFAKLMDVCRDLHTNGIRVDQAARKAWDSKLLAQAQAKRREVRELAGWPELNPASFLQLADLLFERLKIAPYEYSEKTGEPSTDDDSLRAFLSSTWGLDDRTRQLVTAIRDFRRVTKRRGVVVRLRPITESYYEDETLAEFEETTEEREERFRRAKKGKARACGLVLPDGRVHGDWLSHGTIGWRMSSSRPNLQNVEGKLRDMFIPSEGNVFVGCDEAQLELRMVAGLAKCAYYLNAFNAPETASKEEKDPHYRLCVDLFRDGFVNANADQQKKLRRAVKELTYASLYGAENEVKTEIITSSEDENERLIFPDFTIRQVSAFTEAWHRRNPEIVPWWESLINEYRRQHYLTEPVMGLRLDFLDGEEPNKLYNYKPQASGSALVHLATFRMLEEIPFFYRGPGTGLVQQGHDSLVVECPEGEADHVKHVLEESMKEDGRKYGLDLSFIGEAKTGKNLKEA